MKDMRLAFMARSSALVLGTAMGLCFGGGRTANAQTLYNGFLGTTPGQQGWLSLGNINENLATPTVKAFEFYNADPDDDTTVDSSQSDTIYAGYSNYNITGQMVNSAFPTLNASTGFTLNFTVEQEEDDNVVPPGTSGEGAGSNGDAPPPQRAALSVILLDSAHQGIELGFTPVSIFSQSADFSTTSESISTLRPEFLTAYSLTVLGSTYTLSTGGTSLLTGAIKQYTGTGTLATLVYNEPNLVFIGDDTTEDGGVFDIQAASITTGTATAPEPGAITLALAGLGIIAAGGRFKRRRDR